MKATFRHTRKIMVLGFGLMLSAVLFWNAAGVWAAGGDLDLTFNPGTGANSSVLTTAVQLDGKIVIGGQFTGYDGSPRNHVTRLNANGSLDTSFNSGGTGANDWVVATAVQSDGKILIGGAFTTYNGTNRSGIARLNTDGSLDTSFDPGTAANVHVDTSAVQAIAVQIDGRIVIGGAFTTFNGTARNRVARLNLDGSLDTSFDPGTGANDWVQTISQQGNAQVIIGGRFSRYNDLNVSKIARLNTDGSLDLLFNPGGGGVINPGDGETITPGDGGASPGDGITNGAVYSTAIQSNGKIIIGGDFTTYRGTSINRIARLNPDSSIDPTFNPGTGADDTVLTITLQAGGKVVIGGNFNTFNGANLHHIARLNIDGSLDSTFNPGTGANNSVAATALQADGKVIIGGDFTGYNGTGRNHIARLLPAPGAISFSAATYNVSENGGGATITLTRTGGTDNRVVAKVALADVTTSPADYRFTPGALDNSFDSAVGASNSVLTTALQANGRIIIGGFFTSYDGTARNRIARVNTNGSVDTSFDPGTGVDGTVQATAVQTDGKIVVGGSFDTYNGTARTKVARANTNGSLDTTFNSSGTAADGTVYAIALQADGKIIIGGGFSFYNSIGRIRIARLNTDGSLDTTFVPGTGANNLVRTIAVQMDGKIIIGGDFTSYNGTPRNSIARLNLDGSLDPTFDPGVGANNIVLTTTVQTDGRIIIGGLFTSYNGTPRNFIARLNTDGSLDTNFNPSGTGPDATVYTTAAQPDGKIIIGGNLTSYNGTARNFVARLNSDGLLDTSFDPGTGANGTVASTAVQADGRIIISGYISTFNGVARNGIARLESDPFVTWLAGDAADKTITLPIVDDTVDEPDETLTLTLTPLIGGVITGTNATATLTILDNDLPATSISAVSGGGAYNSTATLTATLTSGAPVSGKTISFKVNGTSVGSATTDTNGIATLSGVNIAGRNVGTYPNLVQATFTGDATYIGSNSTGPLTVNKAATTTNVTSSPNPSGAGQSVTFTATVSSSAGTPTGNLQFKVDGSSSGISPLALDGSGVASFSTSSLSVGTHTITADYNGDSNFNTSTGTLSGGQVVNGQPTLSINNSTVTEGNSGTTNATFTVTLSAASALTVTVNYATANGTATAPSDYSATSGTLTFTPGQTTQPITVSINGDTANEATETFTVSLSSPTNATIATAQGTGTIANDDTPSLQLQQAVYSVTENSTQVVVTVTRTGDASQPVTVDYQTADVTASQRSDYLYAAGTLRFAAGEATKTVNVLINEDNLTEPTETFSLLLSNSLGGAVLGTITTTTVQITDDGDTNTGNAIDDAEAFVRQQYHDFFNREPDAPGLAFWTSQITSCAANAACISDRRQNVSAAFFLSIEFQQTGYFYIRLVKSSFGSQAENPRYFDFLRDARQIGEGVVIGQPGADQLLEANRQAFLREYVQRAAFVARYPSGQSSSLFVDALFTNAGATPTATERQTAITAFASGDTDGRAAALRSVAESDSVYGAQYNQAFVLMQYFGYLRRNPDDAPDGNFNGYNFWLGKLISFSQPGENVRDEAVALNRVKRAEMIKAFIVSGEYRGRFGQQ
jgi:uncharacterized delta-60 repeat protein